MGEKSIESYGLNLGPNTFIIGVPKGGTTALFKLLSQHDEIFVPSKKEPRYYYFENPPDVNDPVNKNPVLDYDDYLNLYFEGNNQKIRIDASGYFYSEYAMKRIKRDCPGARIILLFRDPVERAYSHFIYSKQRGFEPEHSEFQDVFKDCQITLKNGFLRNRPYIEVGYYDKYLENLYSIFPKSSVYATTSERFLFEQSKVLNEVCDFLMIARFNFKLNIGHQAKSGISRNKFLEKAISYLVSVRTIFPTKIRSKFKGVFLWLVNKNTHKPELDIADRKKLVSLYSQSVKRISTDFGINTAYWKNFNAH